MGGDEPQSGDELSDDNIAALADALAEGDPEQCFRTQCLNQWPNTDPANVASPVDS